ncbi:Pentatricopeptide repeat-containing protein [Glycine soja]|nr:Pentatricopeptide repeat-containing protein [Glycine soja]
MDPIEECIALPSTKVAPSVPTNIPSYLGLRLLKAALNVGDFRRAQKLYDNITQPDPATCSTLISAFTTRGLPNESIRLYALLRARGIETHSSVFLAIAKACGASGDALRVKEARPDCISRNGVKPNLVSVSSILPACSVLKALKSGRAIHGIAVRHEMMENVLVCSALVNLYARCLNEATWNAVIGGCMENGQTEKAVEMLSKMQNMGFKPNQITISSFLPACSILESLRMGKEIHCYVFRHWLIGDLTTMTTLVYMYAKCGDLNLSRNVFDMILRKDVVAWNTMIIANAMHGNGKEVLLVFESMLQSGIKPNSVTFTGVLSGCSHSRLVEEGLHIFNSMSRDHQVEPDANHYACMVDVFSRAGRLDEAYEFIQKMPMEPTASAWGALLGACRVYKNLELAKISANKLFEIEPNNPGNYVLLFNILVTAKLWSEA